jgi:hypothetical protein
MRALTLSRVREHARYLVDRELLDVAQQYHLAVVIGQRLDGARQIDADVFRCEMREACLNLIGLPFRRSCRPPQQAQAGAARHCKQPRRKRRHRPQCADPAVQQQQRLLDRIVDIGRAAVPRGIAANLRLGCSDQRHQRLGVAAAGGLDQRGIAAPGSGERRHGAGSLRPTMAHIGQKPNDPVRIATAPVPAIR